MEEFLNHLSFLEMHIQENKNLIENQNITEFSERMDICSKAISEESTKLSLGFSNELMIPLIARLKSATDSFVSVFISIPKYFGKYFKLFFKETTLSILKNLKELIESLKKSDGSHKHSLGNLWSQIDNFISIKKTNQNIILLKLNESNKLLTDAIIELHNEMQEYSTINDVSPINDIDDFDNNWNADDIIIVNSVYGILKTLQATCVKLQKVIASVNEIEYMANFGSFCINSLDIVETNSQNLNGSSNVGDVDNFGTIGSPDCYLVNCFDEICGYIVGFSSRVDEVISHLYAPIEKDDLHRQVKQLRDTMNELLCKSRLYNFMNEEDINRINFLKRALEHNFNKFSSCIGVHETLTQ